MISGANSVIPYIIGVPMGTRSLRLRGAYVGYRCPSEIVWATFPLHALLGCLQASLRRTSYCCERDFEVLFCWAVSLVIEGKKEATCYQLAFQKLA